MVKLSLPLLDGFLFFFVVRLSILVLMHLNLEAISRLVNGVLMIFRQRSFFYFLFRLLGVEFGWVACAFRVTSMQSPLMIHWLVDFIKYFWSFRISSWLLLFVHTDGGFFR